MQDETSMSRYLDQVLGLGFPFPVADPSYVVYNFFLRNTSQPNGEHTWGSPQAEEGASLQQSAKQPESVSHSMKSESSVGEAVHTMTAALVPFLRAVVDKEQLSLQEADRSARQRRDRLLQTYAEGLPPVAKQLLERLRVLERLLFDIIGEPLPSTTPRNRSTRLQIQHSTQRSLKALKEEQERLEEVLNVINGLSDEEEKLGREDSEGMLEEEEDALEELYGLSDRLYSVLILPRIELAQTCLGVKTALTVRTEEVLLYAQRRVLKLYFPNGVSQTVPGTFGLEFINQILEPVKEKMTECSWTAVQDVPSGNISLLAGVVGLAGCYSGIFTGRAAATAAEQDDYFVADTLQKQCGLLQKMCGLTDCVDWIVNTIDPDFESVPDGGKDSTPLERSSPKPPIAESPVRRSFRGKGQSSEEGDLHRTMSGTALKKTNSFSRSVDYGTSGGSRVESDSLGALVERLEHLSERVYLHSGRMSSNRNDRLGGTLGGSVTAPSTDLNNLVDTIGSINLWLRRNGLAEEQVYDPSRGKVVPIADGEMYLPHEVNELLGWTKERSELYAEGCLRAQLVREQIGVEQLLEELAQCSAEDFLRTCHRDEMLKDLLQKADEYCVQSESRATVERRMKSLLVMRVKAFHHSGETRSISCPQNHSLREVLVAFNQYFDDALECRIHHLDEDGDRVVLSTNQEWADLVGQLRASVLEGTRPLSNSVSTSRSTHELKLDIYLDPPGVGLKGAQRSTAVDPQLSSKMAPPSTKVQHSHLGSFTSPNRETLGPPIEPIPSTKGPGCKPVVPAVARPTSLEAIQHLRTSQQQQPPQAQVADLRQSEESLAFDSAMRQLQRQQEIHLKRNSTQEPPAMQPQLPRTVLPQQPAYVPGGPDQVVMFVKERPKQKTETSAEELWRREPIPVPETRFGRGGRLGTPSASPVAPQAQIAPRQDAPLPEKQPPPPASKPIGRWTIQPNPSPQGHHRFTFAQHDLDASEITARQDSDDEEEVGDDRPTWNRGTEDHIGAILNSRNPHDHLRALRQRGPMRRAGRKV